MIKNAGANFIKEVINMPRKARKDIKSNYVHLIIQGLNRENIFRKKEWKENYIKILKNKIENMNIEILAYCIMDNHAHFLIHYKILEEISDLMRKVNTTYAMRYNKINNRVGFVFRDRFFTQPILDEMQLYNCLVYIHKNPVKAGICLKMQDYNYSSYNEYIKEKNLITDNSIKLLFGSKYEYIEQFNAIHSKSQEIEDIKDVVEYEDSKEELLKKYENNIKENIAENEVEFGKLLLEMRQKCGIPLREMSNIFKINKDKLNKYIHKIIDNN